ncbi:MAG: hypothetical protein ACLFVU_01930 [Phycisphaerae bacterium]
MSERHGLPPHVFTDDPGQWDSRGRVAVDVRQTAFAQGRQFRISYEYDVPEDENVVLRFESPIDFILQYEVLTCDDGSVRFRAYRSDDVTESGDYDTDIPIFSNNAMNRVGGLSGQVSIKTGGDITPDSPPSSLQSLAVETMRIRTANANSHRASVSGACGGERGLFPGTYYLEIANIGNGKATGVLDLRWEEVPDDIGDWLDDEYGRYD